jgi:hypothetical protein
MKNKLEGPGQKVSYKEKRDGRKNEMIEGRGRTGRKKLFKSWKEGKFGEWKELPDHSYSEPTF